VNADGRFGVNFANKMPKSARGKKMTTASLSTGNGPGSSIPLAPETIRVRNALIEKFSGAPLEEMSDFMTVALANETDELRRLGILAARIYILRSRVANLREFNRNPSLTSLPTLDTTKLSLNLPSSTETIVTDDGEASSKIDQWSRIQMTEPGEVNGVRFLPGTIIDVQHEDADKLISSGKAVCVDMDGNIIDHRDGNFTDSDVAANQSEEIVQTVDGDAPTPALPDDDISTPRVSDDAPMSKEPQEVNYAEANANDDATQTANTTDEDAKAPTS
jgi:hypothetical protein